MNINNIEFGADCLDVIRELQTQLHLNNIHLINKIEDTPNNVQVTCPYHKDGQERRPSAGIRKSDGMFHCFACGATHTLQEVISYCFGHYDGMFGMYGWQWLLKNFATISIEERKDVELDLDRSTDSGRHNTFSSVNIHNDTADSGTDNDNRVFVSEKELDRYRYYHPYWKKRGIVSEDIIERFDLGYDSATHCITMPVRDYNGKVIFVARRSVKTKFFNYPDSVHKPLYGLYEILQSMEQLKITRVERIFVCESMIDALLLWQSGYYAVAMNGLGSASQIEDLKKLPTRNIVLCTDNDEAGEKARKVLRDALNVKLITEIKFPPDRKDVGECTKEEITNISNWEIL